MHIKDYLLEKLCETHIFEMAFSREEFIKKIENLFDQIVENWCLIRYCTLSGRTETKHHWQNELLGLISSLQKANIKLDKTRICNYVIIKKNEYNNEDVVFMTIAHKWEKEHIDIDDILTKQCVDDFINYAVYDAIDKICEKMSFNDIKKFVQEI